MYLKKILSLLIICSGVLACGLSSFAATVYVSRVKSSAADKSSKESVRELVRTAVSEQKGFSLAESSSADFTLKPKVRLQLQM